MRRARWLCWLICSVVLLLASSFCAADYEAQALTGLARVEIGVDPCSTAPQLGRSLTRQAIRPAFATELLRRLDAGSSGSAFCIAPGLLVTNAHVVLSGARYTKLALTPEQWRTLEAEALALTRPWVHVTAKGRTVQLAAEVVAVDPEADLALVHCFDPAGLLQPLELADSDQLQLGQPVVAIGYTAEGLRVARGKIDSLIRGQKVVDVLHITNYPDRGPVATGEAQGPVMRFQHSAPTEAGVSGGPLLDAAGRIVGVAYGLLRPQGSQASSSPINLAITANVVRKFLEGRTIDAPPLAPEALSHPTTPPVIPASATALWQGSAKQLADAERRIRYGNPLAALPMLEERLRRNRYDYEARNLLAQVHYQESRFAGQGSNHLMAAFYQYAWLAFFAPESGLGDNAAAYIEDSGNRARTARFADTPGPRALMLSLELQRQLEDLLKGGNFTTGFADRSALEKLLADCEQARSRSATADVVATAAMIKAYLDLEQAWAVQGQLTPDDPAPRAKRAALLKKALALAGPLAQQMDKSSGAQILLGQLYSRLFQLQSATTYLELARAAYERAATLDPASPTAKAALAAF